MHGTLGVAALVLLCRSDWSLRRITRVLRLRTAWSGPRSICPRPHRGFYRGTQFDWSGVIYSLQAKGHDYYGSWLDQTDPSVHDFVYREAQIVAGPCSAIMGPVDEFAPLGYDEAKAGDTFVKTGVGVLRKTDDSKYDNYHLYEIAEGGRWTIRKHRDKLDLPQSLPDAGSGYAYVYQKTVKLTKGKAEIVLTHSLKNVGKRAIQTTVYNHNFLVLDHQPPGPGVTISVPFAIRTTAIAKGTGRGPRTPDRVC